MKDRILSADVSAQKDQTITVAGWVNSRRDHGGLIFIDLRDERGIVQLTITPDNNEIFAVAEGVRDEYVLKATGTVTARDDGLINKNIVSGDVEVVVESLEILNSSEPLPFQVNKDDNAGEETRLKYRFLDLRRDKMQHMLKEKGRFFKFIRDYMEEADFTDVTTPILANSSPEGARDYLVPSRLHPGTFYALPQAPQQFKQLLMVGGIPRYYQIAACFRDEDPRADRHPGEFYQLDLEMAFVEDGEEVRSLMDPLIVSSVTEFAGLELAYEDIPRIPYEEVMDRFGTDKPDMRYGMEITDLTQELTDCEFGVFSGAIKNGGMVKAICVQGAAGQLSRKHIDTFTELVRAEGAGGLPYVSVENGALTQSIAKFISADEQKSIIEKMGAQDGDMIFFGSDSRKVVNDVLGKLRIAMAKHFELADPKKVALLWVVDFPFYEVNESTGELDFGHNPFSMPKGGIEALGADDKFDIIADQYDMVANGYEICSGGVRNHSPQIMYKAFENVGFDQEHVDTNFAAMINAFKFGAPPHGGCAFGLERLFMILMNEPNIREVIAFPKNGSAVDAMTGAPMKVSDKQLKELHIKLDIKE